MLILNWDISKCYCVVLFKGEEIYRIPMNHNTHLGISYLFLRSTEKGIDQAGFLVESVQANLNENKTIPLESLPEPIRKRKELKE